MPKSPTEVSRALVRKLPPRLQAVARDLARPGRSTLVSVVVPVYNVERYIEECLESVRAQTHKRFEVIVVDDGSPDGSIAIAERIAARDRRIRIVRQENQGLGPARNTGVLHAKGQLLTFLDSDDELHPRALEVMVASLTHSKSDFAVGALIRRTPAGDHTPKWVREVHDVTRTRRTILTDPDILKNVFAWTKMYRIDFFRRVVKEFPAGAYEDQVPAARAYLGGTFDVVRNRIVYWRSRDDATSITQQKADLGDLTTRWNVIRGIEEVMLAAPEAIRATFEAKAIGFDMRPYFEQVPRTEDVYWETLQRELRAFIDTCGYERLRDVPPADRLLAAATYHGLRDDIAELVSRREVRTWAVPGEVRDGTPRIANEYFDGLHMEPDDVITDLSADVELQDRVAGWSFTADSAVVSGAALLKNLNLADAVSEIAVELRSQGVEAVAGVVTRFTDTFADRWMLDAWNTYAPSGFRAEFPLSALDDGRSYEPWITVGVGGLSRTARLSAPDPTGGGELPSVGPLDAVGRWSVSADDTTGGVRLRHVKASHVAVAGLTVNGGEIGFELAADTHESTFMASRGASFVRGSVEDRDGTAWVYFSLPASTAKSTEPRKWHFSAVVAGAPRALSWQHSSADLAHVTGAGLIPALNPKGELLAIDSSALCAIESAELGEDGLRLTGWALAPDGATQATIALVSEHAAGTEVRVELFEGGGPFSVVLPVSLPGGAPLSKDYGFAVEFRTDSGDAPCRVMPALSYQFPLDLDGPTIGATLTVTAKASWLWVRFRSVMPVELTSRYGQERLIRAYQAASGDLTESVLFESFGGTAIGDSPRAISEELFREHPELAQYWSVACLTTPVPPWATAVVRFSPEWFQQLGTATYLVNNNNWPWFFAKREGQVYVQTWHGTPLKRIGYDVPQGNLSLTYRRLMVREAGAWDLLLAQNDFAADALPRAFGYGGTVLNVGYPRNDSLVGPRADARRAEVRRDLGIADGVRAILYAPTWRDNIVGARGYGRVSFLDTDALMAAAEADGIPTVVLYRGHFNTLRSSTAPLEGVIDVSGFPDVNDVILASDALITDYSSIMFDYAVTHRPVYLLVPDLELYGSKTRGFYMDIEEIVPGPLCADTDELISWLRGPYWDEFGDRYDEFVARFAPHDDGAAAERVIAAFTSATGLSR